MTNFPHNLDFFQGTMRVMEFRMEAHLQALGERLQLYFRI